MSINFEEDYLLNPFITPFGKEFDPMFGNIDFENDINNQASFQKQLINYSIDRGSITNFVISNGIAVLCVDNARIHVINFSTPYNHLKLSEFDGTHNGSLIRYLSLDPFGKYLILIYENNICQWFTLETKKAFIFNKLPNVTFSYICWNAFSLESKYSDSILIGTNEGSIFEYQPNPTDFSSKKQKDLTLILDLNSIIDSSSVIDNLSPIPNNITGMKMLYDEITHLVIIMIATSNNLILFSGNPSDKFPHFQKVCDVTLKYFLLGVRAIKPCGDLFVYPTHFDMPTQFSWINNNTVFVGNVELDSPLYNPKITNKQILKSMQSTEDTPLSAILTKYHCIILYYSRFIVINIINQEIIFHDNISVNVGISKGLVYDSMFNTIWLYTSSHIFRLEIKHEDTKIWKVLTEANRFEEALKITENDKINNDLVRQHLAEYTYNNKDYTRSANLFAKTHASFESCVLKFITLDSKEPLLEYLSTKLDMFTENDIIQINILTMWYIDTSLANIILSANTDQSLHEELRIQLKRFISLGKTMSCIKTYHNAYYSIIHQYGDIELFLYVAELLKDYGKIILYYLSAEKYDEAFNILIQNKDASLWYKVSHELFSIMPHKMVDYWTQMSEILDHKQILYNIMHQNFENNSDVLLALVKYLEYCTETLNLNDPFIHNYLITMYCISNLPESVLKYLNTYKNNCYYDKHYILRLCFQYKIYRGCTFILCLMELYEEAVTLALTIDEALAKECANKPKDRESRRKLWLKIAHATVGGRMNVETAKNFMAEAEILRFEDVLPFCADFNKMDTFKNAICESLKAYSDEMAAQKAEIDKLSKISDEIMKENSEVWRRSTHIGKYSVCSLCNNSVFIKPFYTFPCTHSFHQTCYIKNYFEASSASRKENIFRLLYRITDGYISDAESLDSLDERNYDSQKKFDMMINTFEALVSSNIGTNQEIEKLKNLIDEIMTAECIFCGDFCIRNIDQPLFKGLGFLEL